MSGQDSVKQNSLNIGGAHIQIYTGGTATEFERKVSQLCYAAQIKGVPPSTWFTPCDDFPVKEVEEFTSEAPGSLSEDATESDIAKYQERVKLYAEYKKARRALNNDYKNDVRDWEDRKKIRIEAMGYLQMIFQDDK